MSLANQYYLIDDYGQAAGPTGTPGASASGEQLTPTFTAPTIAAAQVAAFIMATAMQRPVRLVAMGGSPPWTLVTPQAANVALTSVPSGIGY